MEVGRQVSISCGGKPVRFTGVWRVWCRLCRWSA